MGLRRHPQPPHPPTPTPALPPSPPPAVFSKNYCPYCRKAIAVLDRAVAGGRQGYELVELTTRPDAAEIQAGGGVGRGIPAPPGAWHQSASPRALHPSTNPSQAYLGQLTGATSVPRVFVGGKCIGGGDDTAAAEASGSLAGLLKELGLAAP